MYGSWERISRLHTAHVLHMWVLHKSSLGSEPNTARRPTHVVLLVASASSEAADRPEDSGPHVRRAPAAGPCAGPS